MHPRSPGPQHPVRNHWVESSNPEHQISLKSESITVIHWKDPVKVNSCSVHSAWEGGEGGWGQCPVGSKPTRKMRLVSKYAVDTDVQNIWNLQAFTSVTEKNSQLASLLQQPLRFLWDSASRGSGLHCLHRAFWPCRVCGKGDSFPREGLLRTAGSSFSSQRRDPRRTSRGTDTADPTCNPGGTNHTWHATELTSRGRTHIPTKTLSRKASYMPSYKIRTSLSILI